MRLGVDDALDDDALYNDALYNAEQIEGAAGKAVDVGDAHDVAGASLSSIRFSSRRLARAPVTFSR